MTPDSNKRRLSLRELLGVVTWFAVAFGLIGTSDERDSLLPLMGAMMAIVGTTVVFCFLVGGGGVATIVFTSLFVAFVLLCVFFVCSTMFH